MDTPYIAITGARKGRDVLEGRAVDRTNAATTAATCGTRFVSIGLHVVTNLLENATDSTQRTEVSGARATTGGTNVIQDARIAVNTIAKGMTTGGD